MNKSDKLRRAHIFGHIKTAVMLLLVVSMLVLVVVYIGVTGIYEKALSRAHMDESFDKLWSVQNSGDAHGLDPKNLLPEFIGYKQASDEYPIGCVGDSDSLTALYNNARTCILELFGKDSICRPLSAAEGKKHFTESQAEDEFVYIRYHTPVLYQLIYAYAAEKLTVLETDVASGADDNVSGYISEIIIVPDRNYAAHRFVAYATDSAGNYYEFLPDNHFVASDFYINRLAEEGANALTHKFEFVKTSGNAVMQPMVDAEIETAVLSYNTVPTDNEEIQGEILRLFDYNPDKLNFYSDGEETVYVDLGSRLRVSNEIISFVATESYRGIEIDSLLGYIRSGEGYTLFDKLTAADNFIHDIRSISPALLGGAEAELCLGDVYMSGNRLVIEYMQTYNSVKVDGVPVLRILLDDNTLCEVEINPVDIRAAGEITYNPKPGYMLRKLYELDKLEEEQHPLSVGLCYHGGEASWTAYFAE